MRIECERLGLLRPILAAAMASAVWLVPHQARADVEACVNNHSSGQLQRDQGAFGEALRMFTACTASRCPAPVHAECEEFLEELKRLMPTVVVAAQDAEGNDLPDVTGRLDGVTVDALGGRTIGVDPGKHVFQFESAQGEVVEQSVVIREGEKARLISVQLPSSAAAQPSGDEPPMSEPSRATAEESSGSHRHTIAMVLGGVGLLASGSFAYFGAMGKGKEAELKAHCAPACDQSEADAVTRLYLIADVSLVLGVASLGAGAYLYTVPVKPAEGRLDASRLVLNVGKRF